MVSDYKLIWIDYNNFCFKVDYKLIFLGVKWNNILYLDKYIYTYVCMYVCVCCGESMYMSVIILWL